MSGGVLQRDVPAGAQAAPFDLDAYLARERVLAESAVERALARWRERLPAELAAAVRHGVAGGGKRLRPVLCVTAYRACGGRGADEHAHDLAASLELIHAYSLMHDDLPCMDDAELRRGLPAAHRVHGEHTTMWAGAVMIPLACLQALAGCRALGVERERARRVGLELCRAAGAGGMVGGQALDLEAEGRRLEPGALDRLHRLKTGALLTASLTMGALAAGASPDRLEALGIYGRAVGLAFQIADDVLDATATAEALGKNPSDLALGKSTYVSLHGLPEARRRALELADRATRALAAAGIPPGGPLDALAIYAVSRSR